MSASLATRRAHLLAERAIEVVADRGLAERLPAAHWRAVVDDLRGACRTGQWEAGLAQAVDAVTAVLAAHFPEDPDRPKANELPDAVVRC